MLHLCFSLLAALFFLSSISISFQRATQTFAKPKTLFNSLVIKDMELPALPSTSSNVPTCTKANINIEKDVYGFLLPFKLTQGPDFSVGMRCFYSPALTFLNYDPKSTPSTMHASFPPLSPASHRWIQINLTTFDTVGEFAFEVQALTSLEYQMFDIRHTGDLNDKHLQLNVTCQQGVDIQKACFDLSLFVEVEEYTTLMNPKLHYFGYDVYADKRPDTIFLSDISNPKGDPRYSFLVAYRYYPLLNSSPKLKYLGIAYYNETLVKKQMEFNLNTAPYFLFNTRVAPFLNLKNGKCPNVEPLEIHITDDQTRIPFSLLFTKSLPSDFSCRLTSKFLTHGSFVFTTFSSLSYVCKDRACYNDGYLVFVAEKTKSIHYPLHLQNVLMDLRLECYASEINLVDVCQRFVFKVENPRDHSRVLRKIPFPKLDQVKKELQESKDTKFAFFFNEYSEKQPVFPDTQVLGYLSQKGKRPTSPVTIIEFTGSDAKENFPLPE